MPLSRSIIIVIALCVAGVAISLFYSVQNSKYAKTSQPIPVTINNTVYQFVPAYTSAQKAKGLSGTKTIPYDGMLFFFEQPTIPTFWMKDMNYAIDMVWVHEDGRVIGVDEMVQPNTYPKTFSPPSTVLYVIEMQSGLAKKVGITAETIVKGLPKK